MMIASCWRSRGRSGIRLALDGAGDDLAGDALGDDLIADLESTHLDDLVPIVDTNLFGASVDPRLSQRAREDAARLLFLGQENGGLRRPPRVLT